MSNQKTINKMRENILSGANNFVGTQPNYCDIQKDCKLLALVKSQYDKVVEQNQSLQRNLLWYKEQAEKDNQYLIKLEEANMLLEQDVETLKKQLETIKERYQINED